VLEHVGSQESLADMKTKATRASRKASQKQALSEHVKKSLTLIPRIVDVAFLEREIVEHEILAKALRKQAEVCHAAGL
jgi:hypothetical protein